MLHSSHMPDPRLIILINWEAGNAQKATDPASGRKAGVLFLIMVAVEAVEATVAAGPGKEVMGAVGKGWAGISLVEAKQSIGGRKSCALHFASAKQDP